MINDFSPALKKKLMRRCFKLALKGWGQVDPNPLVGALLAMPDGRVIAEDYYQAHGQPHAEERLLSKLTKIPAEAVLFISLEPCSQRKKNRSCTDLIIAKNIKRLIYGCPDQNPLINGRGVAKLRAHNIISEESALSREASCLNRVFFSHITKKTCYLALKAATSLDGKIALKNNQSKWITNSTSRRHSHSLRSYYMALIVGKNTLYLDDPRLDCRQPNPPRQPLKIVFSSRGQLPENSQFVRDNTNPRMVIAGSQVSPSASRFLAENNIKLLQTSRPQPDFKQAKKLLYQAGVCSAILEGGSQLFSSALAEQAADYLHLYLAPKFMGADAYNLVQPLAKTSLADIDNWWLCTNKNLDGDIYAEFAPAINSAD